MKKNLLEQRLKMNLPTKELAIVVMANKCDLNHTTTEHDLKQFVERNLELCCPLFLTSAMTKHNLEEALKEMVRLLRKNHKRTILNKQQQRSFLSSMSCRSDVARDLQYFVN